MPKLEPAPWQEPFAQALYDMRVKELGKIRGIVVQDERWKAVSLCMYADSASPGGKSMMVFPYGWVYVREEQQAEAE